MSDSPIFISFCPASNDEKEQILIKQENTNVVLSLTMDNFASMMFMMKAVERQLVFMQAFHQQQQQQLEKTQDETKNDSTMEYSPTSPGFMCSPYKTNEE